MFDQPPATATQTAQQYHVSVQPLAQVSEAPVAPQSRPVQDSPWSRAGVADTRCTASPWSHQLDQRVDTSTVRYEFFKLKQRLSTLEEIVSDNTKRIASLEYYLCDLREWALQYRQGPDVDTRVLQASEQMAEPSETWSSMSNGHS